MQAHYVQFCTIVMIQILALFGTTASLPLNTLRLYLDSASDPETLQMTETSRSGENLVLLPEEDVIIYMPEEEILSSPLNDRPKTSRSRRHLAGSGSIQYQQMWPLLNAARDRAMELAGDGSRRKYGRPRQSVTKRQQWEEIPGAEERLARFSRTLPEQQNAYQIHNVGDLPMFRFG